MTDVTHQRVDAGGWTVARGFGVSSRNAEEGRYRIGSGLARAVEADIIPRLVLAHRGAVPDVADQEQELQTPFPPEVVAFAELALRDAADAACTRIETLRSEGVLLETIYLQLLAPAGAYLRHLWREDLADFADITLALWRLQQVLREFSIAFRSEAGAVSVNGLRALLAPSPGEKQDLSYVMFGLVLVGEFFRRDGWETWIEPDPLSDEFTATIRTQWFDVVEFLVNGDKRLDALAASIRSVRKQSLNKSLGIVLCGRAFVERPELVLVVGGDMAAASPKQGVTQAHNLVGLLTNRG